MEKVITFNLSDNFIERTALFLRDNFLKQGVDLSRIACVFGGKRPALFLRRALARSISSSLIPPRIFSLDEFIDYLISDEYPQKITELDSDFLIYSLAKKHIPRLLVGRESFSEFLPWAKEITAFIEQLDLEGVDSKSLEHIQKSAAIGYEVPPSINLLLQHIITLRQVYHAALSAKGIYSRSMRYQRAAENLEEKKDIQEFEAVVFCNFFYLSAVERKIIHKILDSGKGVCIFQGSQDKWTVLKSNAGSLGSVIQPEKKDTAGYNLSLYQGFDTHSQAGIIRELLKNIKDKDNTVVVLTNPDTLIPFISEASPVLDSFNISMGFPLKRSSLYALLDSLLRVQESRKENKYYMQDYLTLLRHPLVKNLTLGKDAAVMRVIIHKIEELLSGSEESSIGGSIFLSLAAIEGEEKIYQRSAQTLESMGIQALPAQCRKVLEKLHGLLFRNWEEFNDFKGFTASLGTLLEVILDKGRGGGSPFNLKVMQKLLAVKEEFENSSFSAERFRRSEIWDIFRQKLQSEKISFSGSPLKGTQVLGFFETRSLNFENVIIMDVNESVLPKLKIYESLIPREVMLSLGLNRLEKEEEIQRYQFMRLIRSAQNVHLVYEENREKEKSRFIEEILWDRQKKTGKLAVFDIPRAAFAVEVASRPITPAKTLRMVDFLKRAVYSASRLNVYLNCPLRFYYQYVLGLSEKEDLLLEPLPRHIGTFIHELLEETFRGFVGRRPVIDPAFRKFFARRLEEKFDRDLASRMRSDSFLLRRIIANRLEKFLDNEAGRGVEKIICLEEERSGTVNLQGELIPFRYTVDRIDQLPGERVVIIDYKTGGGSAAPKNLKALLAMESDRQSIRDNLRSFQLPLYYYFIQKDFPEADLNAELYNIRTLKRDIFITEEDAADKEKVMKVCFEALEHILSEILNPKIPFVPDRQERHCRHCPFKGLCV